MAAGNVPRVLIIDDEPHIRRVVRNVLSELEVGVIEASRAQEGIDLAAAQQPAVIVLDLGLPDIDGREVCRELRAFTAAPIIVLSARDRESEKVALLDAGADDYVTKPFSPAELQARVRAQLRRAAEKQQPESRTTINTRRLQVDLGSRTVRVNNEAVHLTPTEWSLLRAFVTHAGQTMTHHQLFRDVWGNVEGDAQQYLRVYVGQLRRKIEQDPVRPEFIRTESGVGYRFELPRE
ncbi:MAG: response regulator [Gemmatimonas sp.]